MHLKLIFGLIFGCPCSSRAISYFCHSLRTNCLKAHCLCLFDLPWAIRQSQIFIALPQSWTELIFMHINLCFWQCMRGWRLFVLFWCSSISDQLYVLCIYLYNTCWACGRTSLDSRNGQIFSLVALSLCDFITPIKPAKHNWLFT